MCSKAAGRPPKTPPEYSPEEFTALLRERLERWRAAEEELKDALEPLAGEAAVPVSAGALRQVIWHLAMYEELLVDPRAHTTLEAIRAARRRGGRR